MSTGSSSTITVTAPTTSFGAQLVRAAGFKAFAILLVLGVVLAVAAGVGGARRLAGADPGLGFGSLSGRVTVADGRWSSVRPGDEIVAVGGRVVRDVRDLRAAWTALGPGTLTVRFRHGDREWEETAEATRRGVYSRLGILFRVATGVFLLVVGATVFVLRPGRPVTWVFLLFCSALAFHLLVYLALLPFPRAGVTLESVGLYAAAGAAVLLFSLFPQPLLRERQWFAAFFLPPVAAGTVLAVSSAPPTDYDLAVRTIFVGYPTAILAGLASTGLIAMQFVRARRRHDSLTESKCRALFVAVVLGLLLPSVLGVFQILASDFDFAVKSLPVALFVGITAYSVVRHNAFDVDRFVAAVVGYGATVVGLGLAFAFLLVGLSSILGQTGLWSSPTAGAVVAAAFFLLFSPAYKAVRKRVDRIFLRAAVAEEERLRLLRSLAERVRSEDLSGALNAALATLDTLYATRREIWTSGADGSFDRHGSGTGTETAESIPTGSPLVVALEGGGGGVLGLSERLLAAEAQQELWDRELALAVPILANDRLQGFVALGRKRNGTAYSEQERVFAETVASHLAIAFERSGSRTTRLGPYRLLYRLGTGGMAEVFLAEKHGAGGFEVRVALKRMLPHLYDEPDCVAMFLDEARIAAQLQHPNIVRIYDIESYQGRYFLAMEYVDGPTASRLVRAASGVGTTIPVEVAASVVEGMLRALEYAHRFRDLQGRSLRLVHRDVKPGNLLLSRQGEVKLGDFGIARAEFRLHQTTPGQAKGTLPYMAPELFRGEIAPAADLFSAGAVAYELFTGERAFPKGAEEGRPVGATTLVPDLPPALDPFLEKATAERPEDRFPTARAMREAFLEAITPIRPASAEAIASTVQSLCPPEEDRRDPVASLGGRPGAGGDWGSDVATEPGIRRPPTNPT